MPYFLVLFFALARVVHLGKLRCFTWDDSNLERPLSGAERSDKEGLDSPKL